MSSHVKKKGANHPNRRGGAANQQRGSGGGGGGSRKGDKEAFLNGTFEDTVVMAKPSIETHPSMKDSHQPLKVELQRLYMTKENEKIVMEALKNIHGEDFQLQDKSAYQDKGRNLSKHYWITRSTLVVQGGIDYSNKQQAIEAGTLQISAYALKKLENCGFHSSHCLEALALRDGDTGNAQELLLSAYLGLQPSDPDSVSPEKLSQEIIDTRLEEMETLYAIYDKGFNERIPNRVWAVQVELPYLTSICDKPEKKNVPKLPAKEVCRFFLRGSCKFNKYNCKYSHDTADKGPERPRDDHLKLPGEESKTFEMEIRFPLGNKYPAEAPLIFFTALNPKFPTDACLKITKRLQEEALTLAADGFPAIYTLASLLEDETVMRSALQIPRPGPLSSQPLIPDENTAAEQQGVEADKVIMNSKKMLSSVYQRQTRQLSKHELKKENDILRKRFKEKSGLNEYRQMQKTRQKLPAWEYREKILEALSGHQVVVVSGATGCGKSTQVPQFLLDEWLGAENWDGSTHREIICTQPRRLSAIGVADRVAEERAERVGQSVGYQIRLESKTSNSTRLLFCTTGILLRRLEGDGNLTSATHVIVDEVHERSEESDFLLMILRDLLPHRPDLKIILMSATLNADLFSQYFGSVPVLEIPGRTYPVEQLFLEDALELTGYAIEETSPFARPVKTNVNLGVKKGVFDSADDAADNIDLQVAMTGDNFNPAHGKVPDENLTVAQLFHRFEGYSKKTCKALVYMDPEKINYDLIESILMFIVSGTHDYPRTGSILIFLPGMAEITTLHDQLRDHPHLGQRKGNFQLVPLHSALSNEEQAMVFKRPKEGVRKIVISTNIAETSITIDDCVFVIDAGKMKEKRYDPNKNMESLELCWVSQANALQRRGRAGRVMPGVCIHLFTKHRFEWQFKKQPIPELQRVPLEQLVLRIKVLKLFAGREPQEVLSCTLEPPSEESVSSAIFRLQDVGALDEDRELTPLGHHLAALPVDVRIGKLMLLGAIFSCVDSALTMAACLSYKTPFVSPFNKREEADISRQQFATANSDQLTVLKAYKQWQKAKEHSSLAGQAFVQENFLSSKTLYTIVEMKLQLLELLASIGFVPGDTLDMGRLKRTARSGRDETLQVTGDHLNANNENSKLLASILCAALYPNVVKVLSPQKSFSQKAGGAVPRVPKPEELRFKTKDDGYVAIHPSSINYQVGLYSSPYLVFHEKLKTSRVFIRECSMVPALALVLLTGSSLHVELHQGTSVVALDGGWICLGVDSHPIAEMLKTIRDELMLLLDQKIRDPGFDIQGEPRGQHVVNAIIKLLSTE